MRRVVNARGRSHGAEEVTCEFERIAERLQTAADRAAHPKHLYLDLRRLIVRAVRQFEKCVTHGFIPSPSFCALPGDRSFIWKDDSDARFGAWRVFLHPWLAAQFPDQVSEDVPWMVGVPKTDSKGRPLGRDGKPLRVAVFDSHGMRLGFLPAGHKLTDKEIRERFPTWHRFEVNGEFTSPTDDYTQEDALAHLRALAEVSAEMARALASLASGKYDRKKVGESREYLDPKMLRLWKWLHGQHVRKQAPTQEDMVFALKMGDKTVRRLVRELADRGAVERDRRGRVRTVSQPPE